MKKIIAVFCALVLAPTFNTYAWIGGPFSNNSYFGESGDDGVYEGIATGPNAIGIFRITVANDFGGSQDLDTGLTLVPGLENFNSIGSLTDAVVPAINSGNIFIGGFGLNETPASNIWYYEGVSYFGRTSGTVNSALGLVAAVGNATERGAGTRVLDSSFQATLLNTGELLPSSSFQGSGFANDVASADSFSFTIFGSKVSSQITFGL
ncbi:hypothetical protein VSU19_01260 [Verrucomicrobiales bacterium BCK34]|nr:hypothetical protein [Verrucomicrobiales bacterium BCK34]